MELSPKKWIVEEKISTNLHYELASYDPVLRQILVNRGYRRKEEAERYLYGAIPAGTEALGLTGMDPAVRRIRDAIQRGEKIAVYGDYDVDGVTATALLSEVLAGLGAQVEGYIPNRFEEGYGLNREAIEELHLQGKKLVITVDCGIRSPEEVAYANRLGLDMIISDHHHPGPALPEAVAIINPKQPSDEYPYKDLAGVGLAYKLASALINPSDPLVQGVLDLVTLGTVADLVPLVDENRALVKAGLYQMREPHRQGLRSLMGVARLNPAQISARDIGYVLGPRLNAAGRLDTAYAALELLLARDVALAAKLAQMLDNQNRERQEITRAVQEHAEEQALGEDPEGLLLIAADKSYNVGVVGLAASRLSEKYYRPAIVARIGEETTRGSCRSIPEFHITAALDQCADLMEHHGGHAAAAGFTIRTKRLPELVSRLRAIAEGELGALRDEGDLRRTLKADLELPLHELRPELLQYLEWLEPTGMGNPRAKFISRDLIVTRYKKVGKDGSHLKMTVTDKQITYDAIAFRQGDWAERMPSKVDLFYTYEKNEYQGRESLQLNVIDIKPS